MKRIAILLVLCLCLGACTATDVNEQPFAQVLPSPLASPLPPTMPVLQPLGTAEAGAEPALPPEVAAQQLMLYSHEHWSTLFADAVINRYPAQGNGPAQVLRCQAWIKLPDQVRWLSGPADSAPDTYWIMDGKHIRDNDNPLSPAPEGLQVPFQLVISPDSVYPHPLAGTMGGPLMDVLFPTGLAQRGGYYTFISKEVIASREAYVVEWRYMPDTPTDRLWVDALTGLVLRQQNYGKSGSQVPTSDIYMTRIEFDRDIPAEVFDVNQPRPAGWGLPSEGALSPTPLPGVQRQVFASVLKSDLGYINVRGGPGTAAYEVIGTLSFGQSVPVTGKNEAGDWWQIDFGGQPGWVWAELVELSGETSAVPVVLTPTPLAP